jgi:hypothetical protein
MEEETDLYRLISYISPLYSIDLNIYIFAQENA